MTVFLLLFVLATLLLVMWLNQLPPLFHNRPFSTPLIPSSPQLVKEWEDLRANPPSELILCTDCFGDVETKTYEGLLALSCIEERHNKWTEWVCPRCRKVVYRMSDTIELG